MDGGILTAAPSNVDDVRINELKINARHFMIYACPEGVKLVEVCGTGPRLCPALS
jgi:hypothetical protein